MDKDKIRGLLQQLSACLGDDCEEPATKSTTKMGMEYPGDEAGDGGSEGATDMTPELEETKVGDGLSKKQKKDLAIAKISKKLGGSM